MLAEDLATGEVLRCDVILDVIHKLDVLTTTRELYLEEAPETFELWAQDSQGKCTLIPLFDAHVYSSMKILQAIRSQHWKVLSSIGKFRRRIQSTAKIPTTGNKFYASCGSPKVNITMYRRRWRSLISLVCAAIWCCWRVLILVRPRCPYICRTRNTSK